MQSLANTTRSRRVLNLLAAAFLGAGSLVLGTSVAAGAATTNVGDAQMVVQGCDATTGSTDTATITTKVDVALFANGAIVPLHDRLGVHGNYYGGITHETAKNDAAMSSPICGARLATGNAVKRQWLYCTNEQLNSCGNGTFELNPSAASGGRPLTDVQKARLAYVLDNLIDNTTEATRATSQRLVWCVTEGTADGGNAPAYFGPSDPFLACPTWATIDLTAKAKPVLDVQGPTGTVPAGETARVIVTTTASSVRVATPTASVAVCADSTGTLAADGTLAVPANGTSTLCITAADGTNATITVTIDGITASNLQFWQRATGNAYCQGFLATVPVASDETISAATITFGVPATTTSTTVQATTTTVTETTSTSIDNPTTTTPTPDTSTPDTTVADTTTTEATTSSTIETTTTDVTVQDTPSTTPGDVSVPGIRLPTTGMFGLSWYIWIGIGLLLIGLVLVIWMWRSRRGYGTQRVFSSEQAAAVLA